jgi:hypothetical protein
MIHSTASLLQGPLEVRHHGRNAKPAPPGVSLLFWSILFLLVLRVFLALPVAAAQTSATFKGEITDEHLNCVQTPMKAVDGIHDKLSCVLYWAHFVQPPSKYVLYDAATKTTYQLSDQNLVQPYVAENVMVTGKLDPVTKTIQVTDIKAVGEEVKKP